VLDDETAAALTLYNTYLVADREQQAHERALKKAEKAKDDAAAAVRKLNDRKAPAAETAKAEARYREAAEALQRLRGGDTAAPDAEDDDSGDDTAAESSTEDAANDKDTAGEQAESAAPEDTGEQAEDTTSEDTPPEDTGEQAEDTTSEDTPPEDTGEQAEDTTTENTEDTGETSVGVEASVGDEDLAGNEPASVAGQQ